MIFAQIKNQKEREKLDKALNAAKDKKWYRRLKIISLSAQQYTVPQLSQIFDLCEATIRNYIKSYNKSGLKGLSPDKPPGRPPKIAHWTKKDWDKVLQKTPNRYEKLNTQSSKWTLEKIKKYLYEYHSIDVSTVAIYNSFKKADVDSANWLD